MNRPRYNYTWVVPVQYRTDASPAVTTVLLTASTNSSNAQVSSEHLTIHLRHKLLKQIRVIVQKSLYPSLSTFGNIKM